MPENAQVPLLTQLAKMIPLDQIASIRKISPPSPPESLSQCEILTLLNQPADAFTLDYRQIYKEKTDQGFTPRVGDLVAVSLHSSSTSPTLYILHKHYVCPYCKSCVENREQAVAAGDQHD